MKIGGSLKWICCVLHVFDIVKNVHARRSKDLEDYSKAAGSELKNQLNDFVQISSSSNSNSNGVEPSQSSDPTYNYSAFKSSDEELFNNEPLNITSFLMSDYDGVRFKNISNFYTHFHGGKLTDAMISYIKNLLNSVRKDETLEKTDLIAGIQKNLMKIYENRFEHKNDILQIQNNNLREETRNKAFIPIMYILGVVTTMIKLLVILTLKGVTIGAILLIATYTYKIKKKQASEYHHHPPYHAHYRHRPYNKHAHETHLHYSSGDLHLSDPQDYVEELSAHPVKDLLFSQLAHQPLTHSQPVEVQIGASPYSSDGEKNVIPIVLSEQESHMPNSYPIIENLQGYPSESSEVVSIPSVQIGPFNQDASDVFDQSIILDPNSQKYLYDLELMSPTAQSYDYPHKQYYRAPSGYSKHPYRSIRNLSKRKRIRKKSSKGYYKKSPRQMNSFFPYKRFIEK